MSRNLPVKASAGLLAFPLGPLVQSCFGYLAERERTRQLAVQCRLFRHELKLLVRQGEACLAATTEQVTVVLRTIEVMDDAETRRGLIAFLFRLKDAEGEQMGRLFGQGYVPAGAGRLLTEGW